MPKAIKYCIQHNCGKLYDTKFKRYCCEQCRLEINKNYYLANKAKIKENVKNYQATNQLQVKSSKKKYREENKEIFSEKDKKYYLLNRDIKLEYQQAYYIENKSVILEKKLIYVTEKRKTNPNFRMRNDISRLINKALKNNNASKNGLSIMKYLPFTIQELKNHIEIQFELWMNWDNQGKYIKNIWDDNDPNTWKWNIDHIIPQSQLPYSSMTDDNFKKCWALNNLRPYSAKQNVIDNNRRK